MIQIRQFSKKLGLAPNSIRIHSGQRATGIAMHHTIHIDHWNHLEKDNKQNTPVFFSQKHHMLLVLFFKS